MKYLTPYRSFNLITEAVEGTGLATPAGQPAGATVLSCQFNGQPVTDTKSTLTIPGLEKLKGPSLIVWTVKNNTKTPTIIVAIDGTAKLPGRMSNGLGDSEISVDWTRSPILPGKTGTFTLTIPHKSSGDCSYLMGVTTRTTLSVTTSAGKVETQVSFIREEAPGRIAACEIKSIDSTHNLLSALEIGTGLLGLAFPPLLFVSAGISALDAKMYWDQGNKKMAGLTALFMLLPGSAQLAKSAIGPALKTLGPKGMSLLAGKLAKGTALTVIEKQVVEAIAKNPTVLQQVAAGAKAAAAKAAPVVKAVAAKAAPVVKALKPIAKDVATDTIVNTVYGKGYDAVAGTGQFGLAEFIKTKGYTQNDVKGILAAFGSDDTKEQNSMIVSAMKEGWKLGNIVPEKWRTPSYKAQIKQDTDAVALLNKKLAELGV
jgi:hypothetical protein